MKAYMIVLPTNLKPRRRSPRRSGRTTRIPSLVLEDEVQHHPRRVVPRVAARVPDVRVEQHGLPLARRDALAHGERLLLVGPRLVEQVRVPVAVLHVVEEALVA